MLTSGGFFQYAIKGIENMNTNSAFSAEISEDYLSSKCWDEIQICIIEFKELQIFKLQEF